MQTALAIIAAYLVGSITFAMISSKIFGLADPRSYGSGNPGATNVLRSGNRAAAIITLALDALKGYVPVFAVLAWGRRWGLGDDVETVAAIVSPNRLKLKCKDLE